jgi:hypothetical protein
METGNHSRSESVSFAAFLRRGFRIRPAEERSPRSLTHGDRLPALFVATPAAVEWAVAIQHASRRASWKNPSAADRGAVGEASLPSRTLYILGVRCTEAGAETTTCGQPSRDWNKLAGSACLHIKLRLWRRLNCKYLGLK